MNLEAQNQGIDDILGRFARKFREKEFSEEDASSDLLMDLLGVCPEKKVLHKQYFSRELGGCWEGLLKEARKKGASEVPYFFPRHGDPDWPCDIVSGTDCIDAKYRVGSGDNGTKKNLIANAREIGVSGHRPVLLIFRDDNRQSSLKPLEAGGWTTFIGDEAFEYVLQNFGFDLKGALESKLFQGRNIVSPSQEECSGQVNFCEVFDIWTGQGIGGGKCRISGQAREGGSSVCHTSWQEVLLADEE